MKVLVACEFSGIVRDAFSKRHDAMSCDLLPTESPGPHYQGDVRDLLAFLPFDLMIAFPPCTHLCVSGSRWWSDKQQEQADALEFVQLLLDSPVRRIALENPVGIISTKIRKPDQTFHPWMFGHGEVKRTCLWLKNLPKLMPTRVVDGRTPKVHHEPPGPDRWKNRSRFSSGIAAAMADQWGWLK